MNCDCITWIRELPIPTKIIILKCRGCKVEYTLYPNGQIAYEIHEPVSLLTSHRR